MGHKKHTKSDFGGGMWVIKTYQIKFWRWDKIKVELIWPWTLMFPCKQMEVILGFLVDFLQSHENPCVAIVNLQWFNLASRDRHYWGFSRFALTHNILEILILDDLHIDTYFSQSYALRSMWNTQLYKSQVRIP